MLKGSASEVNNVAKELVNRRLFWLMFIAVPVGLPGCAMGFVSGLSIFTHEHWWQKLFFLIGALAGLSIPFLIPYGLAWLHRIPARRIINELMQMERAALARCLAVLPQSTYFNATCGVHGGAIAVDPSTKTIALEIGQMQRGTAAKTRSITLNPGELRSWSAEKPGVATLGLLGAGHTSSEMFSVHEHNVKQQLQQSLGTGLRLVTENLDATEIFINFDYEIAKGWVVLLDKLANGRLEVPSVAVEFPKS